MDGQTHRQIDRYTIRHINKQKGRWTWGKITGQIDKNRWTDRHRDTQIDRSTNRQIHNPQSDIPTDKKIDGQTDGKNNRPDRQTKIDGAMDKQTDRQLMLGVYKTGFKLG
jgi:hypothetical protein